MFVYVPSCFVHSGLRHDPANDNVMIVSDEFAIDQIVPLFQGLFHDGTSIPTHRNTDVLVEHAAVMRAWMGGIAEGVPMGRDRIEPTQHVSNTMPSVASSSGQLAEEGMDVDDLTQRY